jgi:hypothetical protein
MEIIIVRYNENCMIRILEHIRWDLIWHNTHTTFPIEPSFIRSSHLRQKKNNASWIATQSWGSNMMDFSQILCVGLVWTNRVCGEMGWDETGPDGMGWACGPHTRKESVHLSIYLSIYLLIESQSRLKFNGPTDPSLCYTTSCSGWGYKMFPKFPMCLGTCSPYYLTFIPYALANIVLLRWAKGEELCTSK